MEIASAGSGIVGLGLALNLHQRGIAAVSTRPLIEVKELGVGYSIEELRRPRS